MAASFNFLVGFLLYFGLFSYVIAGINVYSRVKGDCHGGDITTGSESGVPFPTCKGRCDNNSACKSFLFDRLNVHNIGANRCWLKTVGSCGSNLAHTSVDAYTYIRDINKVSCNQFVWPASCQSGCSFTCPAGCTNDTIYGDAFYTTDSEVCAAAVHSGIIISSNVGTVYVKRIPDQSSFSAATRNGVTSLSHTGTFSSFEFRIPKPASPIVTSTTGTQVVISWTACSPSTHFYATTIKVTKAGSVVITYNDLSKSLTTKTIDGLTKGTQYTVMIRCMTNLTQANEASTTVTKTVTTCSDPTLAPSITLTGKLKANDRNKAEIDVTVPTLDSQYFGCDSILSYKVIYQEVSSGTTTDISCHGSCTVTNLDPSKSYQAHVRVTNNAGFHKDGSWISVVAQPDTIPKPSGLKTYSRGANSVVASWNRCSPDTELIGHDIKVESAGLSVRTLKLGADDTTTTIGSLLEGTTYNLTLTCRHNVWPSNGDYKKSKTLTVKTCQKPTTVSISQTNPRLDSDKTKAMIDVTFTPLSTMQQYGCDSATHFIKYKVKQSSTDKNMTCKSVSCTINDLIPYTNYTVWVTVINNAGLSADGQTQDVLTPTGLPSKVDSLDIPSTDAFSLRITWNRPSRPNGVIVAYEISLSYINNTLDRVVNVTGSATQKTISNLIRNTNYTVKVRAYTSAGFGPYSEDVLGYTEERPPSPPRNLTSTSQTTDSITLTWLEPENPNGQIINYKISCHLLTEEISVLLTHIVKRLNPATSYSCNVSGSTSPGYGDFSNTVTVLTKPEPLPTSTTPTTITKTETTITIGKVPKPPVTPNPDVQVFYDILVEVQSKRRRRDTSGPCANPVRYSPTVQCYIAARLTTGDLGQSFTVGDGKTYNGYENKPLEKGKTYGVHFSILYKSGTNEVRSNSQLTPAGGVKAEKVVTPLPGDDSTIAAVVGVICAILAVGLVIAAVIIIRRKRKSKSETNRPITFSHLSSRAYAGSDESDSKPNTLSNDDHVEEGGPLYDNIHKAKRPMMETCVRVESLLSFVSEKKQDKCIILKEEYENLPKENILSCNAALLPENNLKNRFKNILAYDATRVVLEQEDGDPTSDYINANMLKGYGNRPCAYIAIQGPKVNTINDTWRMMWQYNVPAIVMVTNTVENGKRKCEQYWPESGSQMYGGFKVTFLSNETYNDYVIRKFAISKGGEQRNLTHFHFIGWPDHGVPKYPTALLTFRKKVRAFMEGKNVPLVVHCSAGVGRTGAYIAIDYQMDKAAAEGSIDIFQYIVEMRHQRPKMIQTPEQYYFLHDAVLEALMLGDATLSCSEFFKNIGKMKQKNPVTKKSQLMIQYELIQSLASAMDEEQYKVALSVENVKKNRVRNIVPANKCRPYLSTSVPNTTDYINAVFIDGYRKKDCFIATQMPLPETVIDLWRMIYDHSSNRIIMLNQVDDKDKTSAVYWPKAIGESQTFGPFTVTINEVEDRGAFKIRNMSLVYNHKTRKEERQIKQYQFMQWRNNVSVPSNCSEDLLSMIEELQNSKHDEGPITVHCMNGAKQSGLFIAIYSMLEKIRLEQEVDVFQTIKIIRLNRSHLIENIEQYEFCYDIAGLYMDSFETYSNFK